MSRFICFICCFVGLCVVTSSYTIPGVPDPRELHVKKSRTSGTDRRTSSDAVRCEMNAMGISVSSRTIRRALAGFGLKGQIPRNSCCKKSATECPQIKCTALGTSVVSYDTVKVWRSGGVIPFGYAVVVLLALALFLFLMGVILCYKRDRGIRSEEKTIFLTRF